MHHLKLIAGLKGDRGPRGPVGDLTPELVAARDLAVDAAATSDTNADRTREDRLATTADRSATASDRAQTTSDRKSTGEDALQTQSDRLAADAARVQTGQDRLITTTARDETLSLRDSASGHRAAAQAAATASQNNRDATTADRDVAANAAKAARADATATAADRAQTGADRTETTRVAAEAAKFDPALYHRRDGSSGVVQIGTTNGNNGALRLARRTSGFSSSIEFLDGEGAVAGLFGRSEGGGIPFIYFRVVGAATDTLRFFADNIQILVGGAYRAVWHTGTAPEATDAEADAGSVGAARMWSPARLWRAVRAALPLVSQSVAEAGTDTVARSWSVLRVWQAIRAAIPTATDAEIDAGAVGAPRALTMTGLWRAVRAVIANDKEVPVAFYTGALLDGLNSVILDMPAGFNKYRIEFGGLRLRSGSALLTLRNGPSGGALNSGDSTYQDVTIQRRGGVTDEVNSANNAFVIAGISTSADQYGEIVIHDLPGQFWVARAAFAGIDSGEQTILSTRGSRYAPGANPAGGRWGRIGLLFGGVLTNAGYIRIYGVRT